MTILSIITASHNNLDGLKNLYNSIVKIQSNKFEWVIKDSGHCLATASWLGSLTDVKVIFNTEYDNGIYGALNAAIKISKSDYYIVIGSDDDINPTSITLLLQDLYKNKFWAADVISLPILYGGYKKYRNRFMPKFVSVAGLISSHSVGTIIRKNLHYEIGYYDESYRILADSLFILTAYKKNKKFAYPNLNTIGRFSLTGISSHKHALRIIEAYNYNVQVGSSALLQSIILALRLIKYKLNSIDF